MIRVRMWGTRGAIAAPGQTTQGYGGNTSCVQVLGYREGIPGAAMRADNPHLILDGGTGLLSLQGALMAGPWGQGKGQLHFLLSHYHWDHIIGIPFFEPMFTKGNRFTFYGTVIADLRESIERLFTSVYSPLMGAHNVEAELIYRRLQPNGMNVAGFRVSAAESRHPGGALSFRVQYGPNAVVYTPDHSIGAPAVDSDLAALAHGADLWILNGMFTPDERSHYRGWGQSSHLEAVQLALQAGVKMVVLFHHDPWKDDKILDRMGSEAKEAAADTGMEVLMARDGMVVEVGGEHE